MSTAGFTIVLVADGVRRKLCKVLLTDDGSYMLTVPYHTSGRVMLTREEINYVHQQFRQDEPIEFALLDDDAHRLKLSHHPDGFVQFSGEGIVSGRNEDGSPKGMGLQSWKVASPTAGPATGVTILGVQDFAEAGQPRASDVEFRAEDMVHNPWDTGYQIELYYMPRPWTRFLRKVGSKHRIMRQHPSGAVLDLKACWNPAPNGGIVGVDIYPVPVEFGEAQSGFAFGSPSGNLRYNEDDELVGEAIYASFPALALSRDRGALNLVYRPLDDPSYESGGGKQTG